MARSISTSLSRKAPETPTTPQQPLPASFVSLVVEEQPPQSPFKKGGSKSEYALILMLLIFLASREENDNASEQ